MAQPAPPREIFPSDYTPSPCAPASSCTSFPDSEMKSAGAKFLSFELDDAWMLAHADEVKNAFAPLCRKHATCMTMPASSYMFCDDVLAAEARPICDRLFPHDKSARDSEQCKMYLETYLMGIDQNAINAWKAAQECAKKQPATHTKPLDIWMTPASLPYEYKGYVTFYSTDPDTKVPVLARVTFENQIIYAEANPSGESATYYPFKVPFKYIRIANKEGHTDAVTPLVTVTAPGYPVTTFRLPAVVPRAIVEMTPAPSALHAGDNAVTVSARDSVTGRPVDARVMLGANETGYTNQPITITLPRHEKRPEIWVKPLLNRYADVVVAPAEK